MKQILLKVISDHVKGKKVTGQITPDQPDWILWWDDHLSVDGDAVYLDFSTYPCS